MKRFFSAALWPTAAFLAVLVLHFVWLGLFPEQDAAQAGWVILPVERTWFQRYLETQSYWLGYAYALSAAFGTAATIAFLRDRTCATRNAALGGVSLTGGLALAGCFLVGCCGSPMLAVWLGLFGTAFLPFAKPAIALVTTAMILVAWLWMGRQRKRTLSGPATVDWQRAEDGAAARKSPATGGNL